MENVKLEMEILGVCGIRWLNNKNAISDERRIIYVGGEKNERGVRLMLDQVMKKFSGILSTYGHYSSSEIKMEAIQHRHHSSLRSKVT